MNFIQAAGVMFEPILNAIMPPRGRSARTKHRVASDIPLEPTVHELLGARIATLMSYRRKEAQDLIRSLKFDASSHAATLAADLLADYLREEIASLRTFSTKRIVLAPVPLHKTRERERGYNQVALILGMMPKEYKDGTMATIETRLLERKKATPPQTRLARNERIKNVAGVFKCADFAAATKSHIFLIDDVTTTGATLLEASKPLKKAGAEVTLLALARA